MRSRVYETVESPSVCLSVRLSHQSAAADAAGGQEMSIDGCRRQRRVAHAGALCSMAPQHGAQQQMRVVSCWQPRDEAEHRLVEIYGYQKVYFRGLSLRRAMNLSWKVLGLPLV